MMMVKTLKSAIWYFLLLIVLSGCKSTTDSPAGDEQTNNQENSVVVSGIAMKGAIRGGLVQLWLKPDDTSNDLISQVTGHSTT